MKYPTDDLPRDEFHIGRGQRHACVGHNVGRLGPEASDDTALDEAVQYHVYEISHLTCEGNDSYLMNRITSTIYQYI